MTHIGFCMGEYNHDTCSDCLCEADCVKMGHDELVERLRREYGLLDGSAVKRLESVEADMKRYRVGLVELAMALSKSNPNIACRSHISAFWEIIE